MPARIENNAAASPPGDDLDNLLDEDMTLDDIFKDVDTDMRASKPSSFPVRSKEKNHNDILGIDEAVKVEKKRAPIAKLDQERYTSLRQQWVIQSLRSH